VPTTAHQYRHPDRIAAVSARPAGRVRVSGPLGRGLNALFPPGTYRDPGASKDDGRLIPSNSDTPEPVRGAVSGLSRSPALVFHDPAPAPAPHLLDVALSWAERGVPVFPLQAGSKAPYQGSHGVHDATTDPEAIKDMWCLNSDANVGLAVGAADPPLTVIDLDTKRGNDGPDEFFALQLEAGEIAPPSFTVSTPSGGQHVYFRGKTRNRAAMAPGVDVRSDGGYVLAPGSRLDAREGQSAGVYATAQDAPIAMLPRWLADHIGAPTERTRDPEADARADLDRPSNIARALDYMRQEVEKGRIAREGHGGSDFLYRTCALLWDRFALSPQMTVDVLQDSGWNDACEPPWHPDELHQHARHARSYAKRAAGTNAPDPSAFDHVPAPGAGTKDDGRRHRGMLLDLDGLEAIRESAPLIEGLFVREQKTLIHGKPKAGKTHVTLDAMLHLATGQDWHGHRVSAPARVVYLSGEGRNAIRRRVRAWLASRPEHREKVKNNTRFRVVAPQMHEDGVFEELVAELSEFKPDLIVFDTAANHMRGLEENSAKDVGLFFGFITKLQRRLGDPAVCVVHHDGKDGKQRGSNAFAGEVDVLVHVEKRDGLVVAQAEPSREIDEWDAPVALRIVETDEGLTVAAVPPPAANDDGPQKAETRQRGLEAMEAARTEQRRGRKVHKVRQDWTDAAVAVLEERVARGADAQWPIGTNDLAGLVNTELMRRGVQSDGKQVYDFLRRSAHKTEPLASWALEGGKSHCKNWFPPEDDRPTFADAQSAEGHDPPGEAGEMAERTPTSIGAIPEGGERLVREEKSHADQSA